jgi:hypothetical protein
LRALPETEAPDFFGNQMDAAGLKQPRRTSRSRKGRITRLLRDVEKRLDIESGKVTLGDFIRLMQLERELEEEEQPREIIVSWKDPPEAGCESR